MVHIEGAEAWARVSQRSASRGWVVLGVAAAALLGVGSAVGLSVAAGEPAGHDDALLAGWAAGATAAGASLPLTLLATRKLGTELE